MPIDLFSVALPIHVTTVFFLVGTVIVTDALALLWVLGKRETLPTGIMHRLHKLVWLGLLVMVASGAFLFEEYSTYLLQMPAFWVKMGFVAALIINGLVIGRHIGVAGERSFISLTPSERYPLLISGAVSTISWIGAITAATQLGL